jgi:hypothetical protein
MKEKENKKKTKQEDKKIEQFGGISAIKKVEDTDQTMSFDNDLLKEIKSLNKNKHIIPKNLQDTILLEDISDLNNEIISNKNKKKNLYINKTIKEEPEEEENTQKTELNIKKSIKKNDETKNKNTINKLEELIEEKKKEEKEKIENTISQKIEKSN